MGRGGAIYLSYTALVLLSAASGTSAVDSFWAIHIEEGPAPSPEDGPPFSAHAIRNRALLPYEVIAVCATYVGTILILGTLLLTVGRTFRRRAQGRASKPQEMVKPYNQQFGASPVSMHQTSWYNLRSKRSATSSIRSGVSPVSPAVRSVVSFDAQVIENDKQKRQEEMERLYAAVMAHDESKFQGSAQTTTSEIPANAPPEYSRKNPPRLVTSAPALKHLQAPDGQPSPLTPKSPVRAIYPPDSPMPPMPASPTSPIRAEYPTAPLTPTYLNQASQAGELKPNRDSRTSSFGSSKTFRSGSPSAGTKIRKSLRNLKISAPLPTSDNDDGARTPLSPRFYIDPGIPPEPPTSRTTESQYPPSTPGTAKSWPEPDLDEEQIDQVRDLPRPHPNRASSYKYDNPAQTLTTAASTRPDPTGTTPQNKQPIGTSSVNNALPFRQLQSHQQAQNAAYAAAHPLSPMTWNQGYPLSAGPVKTTFLERRNDRSGGGVRTAGLATPYSPYMPFTPLTPVTPHLTSRAERKQREREERAVKGVIMEEDAVKEEAEIWSSGY